MVTSQQHSAIILLRDGIKVIKCNAFDRLKMLAKDPAMLSSAGFKTFEEAAENTIKTEANKIEKLIREYEKAYPK